MYGFIGALFLIAVIVIILVRCIRIVPQAHVYVIERLGIYHDSWQAGLHIKAPIIDRVARKISIKEQIADFPPQGVITKDNVTIEIDTVVFFQVVDPKLFCYGIQNPVSGIEQLVSTTLRNLIGDLELDQSLTSRDTVNTQLRDTLDTATDPWGIKVNRVELKNINPPKEIQNSMEKQMKAEREKRARILEAEGIKQSEILKAEGRKQSAILQAEAQRETLMKEADGQASAIKAVQEATALGIKMINESRPSQEALALEAYKALVGVANGQATKLIIPSDLQGVLSLATAVIDSVKKPEDVVLDETDDDNTEIDGEISLQQDESRRKLNAVRR